MRRRTLDEMDLSLGRKVRLHRMLSERGLKDRTLLCLPMDQGMMKGFPA